MLSSVFLPSSDTIRGMAVGFLAFLCLTILSVFIKILSEDHSVMELVFYRNITPVIAISLYIAAKRNRNMLFAKNPPMLMFRVFVGTLSLLLTFQALKILPLAEATVLFFTSTLITTVLGIILLREKVGIYRFAAIIIGFCGVIMIASPHGEFKGIGIMIALGAALGHASSQIILRQLRLENPLTVAFYFMLGGIIIPAFFIDWSVQLEFIANKWEYLLCLGLSGGIGQFLLTLAFRLAPATVVSPINYTTIIWASGFDIFIFHHMPDISVYIGGSVVIAANLFILYREHLKAKHAEP